MIECFSSVMERRKESAPNHHALHMGVCVVAVAFQRWLALVVVGGEIAVVGGVDVPKPDERQRGTGHSVVLSVPQEGAGVRLLMFRRLLIRRRWPRRRQVAGAVATPKSCPGPFELPEFPVEGQSKLQVLVRLGEKLVLEPAAAGGHSGVDVKKLGELIAQ